MPKNLMAKRTSRSTPYQRQKSINDRMRSINRLSEDVMEKSNTLNFSLDELINARKRLQHCLHEIDLKESRLRKRVEDFEKTNSELEEMSKDIKTLHKFKDTEQMALLDLHSTLALQDSIQAKKQIKHLKYELDDLSPIVPEYRNEAQGKIYHCFDKVITPVTSSQESLPSEIYERKNIGTCSICFVNPVNRIILTCGHMCLCDRCSTILLKNKNQKCPICRSKVDSIIEPKFI